MQYILKIQLQLIKNDIKQAFKTQTINLIMTGVFT